MANSIELKSIKYIVSLSVWLLVFYTFVELIIDKIEKYLFYFYLYTPKFEQLYILYLQLQNEIFS